MTENKKGALRSGEAPENQHERNSITSTQMALVPRGGVRCAICEVSIDLAHDRDVLIHRIAKIGTGLSYAMAICATCRTEPGQDLTLLFGLLTSQAETEIVKLKRTTVRRRKGPQRLPPYARALQAAPPPNESILHAVLEWAGWQAAPHPAFVLPPDQPITAWNLAFTEGYRVRVLHDAGTDPERLFQAAQAFIDAGALAVELSLHPSSPAAPLRHTAIHLQAEDQ